MRTDAFPHGDGAASPVPSQAVTHPRSRRGLMIAGVAAVALAGMVVVTGVLGRMHQTSALKSWTAGEAVPVVTVVRPTAEPAAVDLTLPGNLQAFYNAQIYSRVSGYVHGWFEDIGAHVKSGQLLATIDTPELDQQIEQARADVAVAQANMQLASTTAKRLDAAPDPRRRL